MAAPVVADIDDVTFDAGTVGTPQLIDASVTVTDAEDNFSIGWLFVSDLLPADILSIRSTGTNPGEISVDNGNVLYGGALIGTYVSGGAPGQTLVVTLSDASAAAVQALIAAIEFSTTGTPIASRTLTVMVVDAAGESGSDTVTVNITGGAGNDVISGTPGADVIDGGDGNDVLKAGDDGDTLNGEGDNDILAGGFGDDILNGGDGNDDLRAGAGADTMVGGDGNDIYWVDNLGDTADETGTTGTDIVKSSVNFTLGVNIENLSLTGTALEGTGNGGANVITGNASDNILAGEAGNDTLNGGAGNDTMYGGDDQDTLNGSVGDDILSGGNGDDTLNGAIGNDSLDGGAGVDQMNGGGGDDTYGVDNVGDVVNEAGGNGHDKVNSSITYILGAGLEDLTLLNAGGAINGTGNSLANYLVGNDFANVLDGGTGNDVIEAGDGADTLTGGDGNDELNGGLGADAMSGGAGNDLYYVDDAGDTITDTGAAGFGGYDLVNTSVSFTVAAGSYLEEIHSIGNNVNLTGNEQGERLYGDGGVNTLNGMDGADTLFGASGNDILLGGGGNDSLDGGLDADAMTGGQGNDTYYVDDAGDTVTEASGSGSGIDTVRTTLALYTLGANVENLFGDGSLYQILSGNSGSNTLTAGAFGATLKGNDGDDSLVGGIGNDLLVGGFGGDSMVGGLGNDTYIVDSYTDYLFEAAAGGVDTVRTILEWTLGDDFENLELLDGTTVNGTGNALNNVITGNKANNTLYGLLGDDTLSGGVGDDVLYGADDNDTLSGSVGNDELYGGAGGDNLSGGNGDDILDGGAGDDYMAGGLGNDTFYVTEDGDTTIDVIGGGYDVIYSSAANTFMGAFIEDLHMLAAGVATGSAQANHIYGSSGSDTMYGLDGNDILEGGDSADVLRGGNGNDTLLGGDGVDFLYGHDGKDTLNGGAGDSYLYGGLGDDTYIIDLADYVQIAEDLNEGTDTVRSSFSHLLGDNVENLVLTGTSDIDGLGNALNNVITGNDGVNVLFGDAGNDTLNGGGGADEISGGAGNDRMTGGLGADTFTIMDDDMMRSELALTKQSDVITDFNLLQGDRIDLSAIDANVDLASDQAFSVVTGFTHTAGEAKLVYNAASNSTALQLDVDGDGKADYQLIINGDATDLDGWIL